MDEGPGFGQLAGLEEVAHLLCEGGDGVGAVQKLPPLFQQPSRLLCGDFKGLLALPEFHDEVRSLGHVHAVALCYEVPNAAQLLLHLLKLPVDTFQPLPLVAGHAVHLLVQQLHQVSDVGLGEDVGAKLVDDDLLEFLGVEPGGLAGAFAALEEGVADVVGVLAALGLGCGHGLAAGLALGQSAEQVGAGDAAGVHLLRGAGLHRPGDALELLLGNDGRVCVLDAHGRRAVLGVGSPDHGSGVRLVGEHEVDGGLEPLLAVGSGDSLGVEGLGDVEGASALESHVEDAPGHGVGGRVQLQLGARLGPVLDVDPLVAVGGVGGHPEASGRRLPHPPRNLLGKIFAVKFVHALDDGLQQPAGSGVLGLLGDGDHSDSSASQHGLEGDGVLALAGESGELPDKDFLEGGLGLAGRVQHLLELGPVGDAPALGLVHVLADYQVVVLLGVVPERPQLGGHGQVHVLAVAGYPGVEGHWRAV